MFSKKTVSRCRKNIVIPGDDLFGSARDIGLLPGLRLEGYPNRDSLKYQGTTERMDAVDSLSRCVWLGRC